MKHSTAKILRLLITLWSTTVLASYAFSVNHKVPKKTVIKSASGANDIKLKAFKVLQSKCNTCHETGNPSRVFTLDNMDTMASKINRQVFIFKRMPKGRDQRKKMTPEEMAALKNWLQQTI